ncbi:MAG TPA: 16S rRNA (cytosine(967)-C(5))-methyltransferase RsmB [Candidatus Galloscillospira stercoripullorum]|nr:16S rRNA (cytosine(967)-C(5))-methyltransferase RsmB [Candidatus Galloscillospira stercoripullorum]
MRTGRESGGSAREVALLALSACEKQGAWSNAYLKKAIRDAALDSRDAALCTRLCFGVLQNKGLLDHYLGQLSHFPLEKMEERVVECLRLGAYQLLFLDRVPPSAAVNESVNLARRYGKNPRAAGVVNGILRNLLRSRDTLQAPQDLGTRYSHPDWLVKEFSRSLPDAEELEALLAADNQEVPTMAQVNLLRSDVSQALALLHREGMEAEEHPWLRGCLLLRSTGDLERSQAFRDGIIYIQDPAARLAVMAAGAEPGMRVLDACAAPGGKSFAAAIAMGDKGAVVSCDIHPHKEQLIRAGAERLGLTCITAMTRDAKQAVPEWEGGFDLVIADVPCSGLGIIRKKPDIRYKDPAPLSGLPAVQGAILDNVGRYVRPGGVLLYATCTLLERENRAVVDGFLTRRTDFVPEGFTLPGPVGRCEAGMLTLWPHRHGTDGFFFAKLRRKL